MNIDTRRESIEKRIFDIANDMFNLDDYTQPEDKYTVPLTGKPYCLSGRDLAYLIITIENEYHLTFSREQMLEYKLNSFHDIACCIIENVPESLQTEKAVQ